MDTQIVELIGRHHITAELLRAGLEVAAPVRDRRVDLIAYADIDERLTKFAACPIPMKAAMKRSFGLATKYARVHNLLIQPGDSDWNSYGEPNYNVAAK